MTQHRDAAEAERAANTAFTSGQVWGALHLASERGFLYHVETITDSDGYQNAVLLTHKTSGNRYIVEVTPQEKV